MNEERKNPAGDRAKEQITFFGSEIYTFENHIKGKDNYLYYKNSHRRILEPHLRFQSNLLFTFTELQKINGKCATVQMLPFCEESARKYLRFLIIFGKVVKSKNRYPCKITGRPAHYYMALPESWWFENNL